MRFRCEVLVFNSLEFWSVRVQGILLLKLLWGFEVGLSSLIGVEGLGFRWRLYSSLLLNLFFLPANTPQPSWGGVYAHTSADKKCSVFNFLIFVIFQGLECMLRLRELNGCSFILPQYQEISSLNPTTCILIWHFQEMISNSCIFTRNWAV